MEGIGLEVPRSGFAALGGGGHGDCRGDRVPDHRPSVVHSRRQRHRDRRRPRRPAPTGGQRPGDQSGRGDPRRGLDRRLEGVRARGHARRGGQLRGGLLHREPRSHGGSHRRLGDRGPGPDADRRGVPGDARRRLCLPPSRRGRDGRIQRPVRGGPRDGPASHHRNEPEGLAVVCARLEGNRLPDRQDRGKAGRRLSPRRGHERHHEGNARPASSPRSTMWSPRSRDGRSRSCPGPRCGSARACNRWARSWPSAARSANRCKRRSARSSRDVPG